MNAKVWSASLRGAAKFSQGQPAHPAVIELHELPVGLEALLRVQLEIVVRLGATPWRYSKYVVGAVRTLTVGPALDFELQERPSPLAFAALRGRRRRGPRGH